MAIRFGQVIFRFCSNSLFISSIAFVSARSVTILVTILHLESIDLSSLAKWANFLAKIRPNPLLAPHLFFLFQPEHLDPIEQLKN
ncbi:hypothetical protein DERF_009746 [Dermatophagoides farinae]|uniref:Uncharacterized protein n=1 Tax=Dermatophagoides farinae TaxID=6954 RepID=A0A922HX10_DERFA|nr:hypothetical protein DERF_009746 [Dermatophagoides farinae]